MHLREVNICSILSNMVASNLIHAETLSKAWHVAAVDMQEQGHSFKKCYKFCNYLTHFIKAVLLQSFGFVVMIRD